MTDEHIVPQTLGGKFFIADGTCDLCADTTKKFEERFARWMYWPLKTSLGIRGNRKHRRGPTHWQVEVEDGNRREVHQIEIGRLPRLYLTAEIPPAGIFSNAPLSDRNPEINLQIKGSANALKFFTDSMGAGKVEASFFLDWNALCRQLAKIAHCYAVVVSENRGLRYLLPPIVKGESPYFSHLIGGLREASHALPFGIDLDWSIHHIRTVPHLLVRIGLFGGRLPTYEVVAAEINDTAWIVSRLRRATER